ncbi:uncharacterized protein METZ01_LOCUS310725, partial [marine metagenome]
MEICKGFHKNVHFAESRSVNWILENNLLIKSSKDGDLNAGYKWNFRFVRVFLYKCAES